jgi:multiple sugar transport system ATP-binding protein
MSFLPATLMRLAGGHTVRLGDGMDLALPAGRLRNGAADGAAVILGLRPEHLTRAVGPSPEPGNARMQTTVELLQPTGSRTFATFRLGDIPVTAELEAHDVSHPGEKIAIDINLSRASLFDAKTERAI